VLRGRRALTGLDTTHSGDQVTKLNVTRDNAEKLLRLGEWGVNKDVEEFLPPEPKLCLFRRWPFDQVPDLYQSQNHHASVFTLAFENLHYKYPGIVDQYLTIDTISPPNLELPV